MAQKATVWWALYRYFPALDGQIGPDTVDVAQNAMILDTSIHGSFDNHEFALEPYVRPNNNVPREPSRKVYLELTMPGVE